jgi:hypothetical protein
MVLAPVMPAGTAGASRLKYDKSVGALRFKMTSITAAATAFGVAVWLAAASAAQAQQFSADLVYRTVAGEAASAMGKINVSNRKVRIEPPDLPIGFFIVRADVSAAYFVRPALKTFMDAKQSSKLTQLLVPVDPEDPCRQWQAMAQIAGAPHDAEKWRCVRIGNDSVDGRTTTKYQAISPRKERYFGWIDPRLNFLIRFEAEDGTAVDVINIQEMLQHDSLFEIPADYRKFDPQQLIERIKHSDVWVEPEK